MDDERETIFTSTFAQKVACIKRLLKNTPDRPFKPFFFILMDGTRIPVTNICYVHLFPEPGRERFISVRVSTSGDITKNEPCSLAFSIESVLGFGYSEPEFPVD
jgi:hypothetical protein